MMEYIVKNKYKSENIKKRKGDVQIIAEKIIQEWFKEHERK